MEHILNVLMADGSDYYGAWVKLCLCLTSMIALVFLTLGFIKAGISYVNDTALNLHKIFPLKLRELTGACSYRGSTDYGLTIAALVLVCIFGPIFLPILLIPCYLYPVIPLAIVTTYVALRLSRAVVRIKKKLSTHIADINAHSDKKEN